MRTGTSRAWDLAPPSKTISATELEVYAAQTASKLIYRYADGVSKIITQYPQKAQDFHKDVLAENILDRIRQKPLAYIKAIAVELGNFSNTGITQYHTYKFPDCHRVHPIPTEVIQELKERVLLMCIKRSTVSAAESILESRNPARYINRLSLTLN